MRQIRTIKDKKRQRAKKLLQKQSAFKSNVRQLLDVSKAENRDLNLQN